MIEVSLVRFLNRLYLSSNCQPVPIILGFRSQNEKAEKKEAKGAEKAPRKST